MSILAGRTHAYLIEFLTRVGMLEMMGDAVGTRPADHSVLVSPYGMNLGIDALLDIEDAPR